MQQDREQRSEVIRSLNARFVACHACDALWERPTLEEAQRARCGHCNTVIVVRKTRGAERAIALMMASLCVYLVAVTFPFMRMESAGLSNQISIIDAVLILAKNGMMIIAALCAALILFVPVVQVVALLVINSSMLRDRDTRFRFAWLARLESRLAPWAMAEIFMLGVIVSLVKVGALADISLGPAFWSMTAFVIFLTMGTTAFCRDTLWDHARRRP
ncbi:MAG: paraquat-inducible protein A [Pseudomonadota bacterium]